MNAKLDEGEFQPADFFIARTPLLSATEWQRWSGGHHAADAAERSSLWFSLKEILARQEIRQALFLAAPRIEAELRALDSSESMPSDKWIRTFVRYFARMSGRCDPFGLLAGCSLGHVAETTHLELPGLSRYRSFTTLDVGFLTRVTEALRHKVRARPANIVQANPSLYEVGDRLRYIESYIDLHHLSRSFHLTSIEPTVLIDLAIAYAMQPISIDALAKALCRSETDLTRAEAREFIVDLLDAQILRDQLEPTVTGCEPMRDVIERLGAIDDDEARLHHEALGQTEYALRALDARGLGRREKEYQEALAPLPGQDSDIALLQIIQTDLFKPASAFTIGPDIAAAIKDAALLFHRITPYSEPPLLDRFRAGFMDRFENCEIPLLEALDPDIGIDLGRDGTSEFETSPWLRGLGLFAPQALNLQWRPREAHLLSRIQRCGLGENLELTDADIQKLECKNEGLPHFLAVKLAIGAGNEDDLQNGRVSLFIKNIFGPSGTEMFTRFLHSDGEIADTVTAWIKTEEVPSDAIIAEIVHLPHPRIGNIVCRPLLRDYEIDCFGRSGADPDRQIPLSDLTVRMEGSRIVLRSMRLQRDVVPRLTAAHYAAAADLVFYPFLWALQHQEATGQSWDWGALASAPFLPRVTHRNVVLARATWRLEPPEAKGWNTKNGVDCGSFASFRKSRHLPRHVLLVDGELELPLDLDNLLCADILGAELSKAPVTLIEQFPPPEELCVKGPEGRFAHEIILPLRRVAKPSMQEAVLKTPALPIGQPRALMPGDEWISASIFASEQTQERGLLLELGFAAQQLREAGIIDRWFFIRFWDPKPHLRLRLKGAPKRLTGEAWPHIRQLIEPLLASREIASLRFDAYVPELNRYGGPEAIDEAERLFEADSDLVIALLQIEPQGLDDSRERLALLSTDRLMKDFGLDLPAREAFAKRMAALMADEMQISAQGKIELGHRFRDLRQGLTKLFGGKDDVDDFPLRIVEEHFAIRAPTARRFADLCRGLEQKGKLTTSFSSILASIIHMGYFRLMTAAPRAIEFVVYDILERLYKSECARGGVR